MSFHGSPLNPSAGRSSAGDRPLLKLGRYEIVRELGKGAMGIVYLAKDPLIGRLVALKTIRGAVHGDDDETKEFQQRFVREAQAAGILNHPSIVTVFDIGQDETTGTNFIAMEYVEGHNLKEILAQGRPLTFDEIGEIIAQVGEALDFAHSKGIVHRDVKPANIILLDGNRAKIMDFGIAKIASGVANLTTTGQFLGTPNYMAPEQIKGAPVDGRTDIFSLGICLYECLTRRKPFGGESLTSISYKIVHEPFPPLHEVNPQIPDGYEEVVGRCLAKDPAKRYQRGKELANALRAVVRGEMPGRSEPMLAEETIITRENEKIPTVEMPFPEAAALAEAVAREKEAAHAPSRPTDSSSAKKRLPIKEQLLNTITRAKRSKVWYKRLHPAAAAGILAILLAGLGGAVLGIQKQKPKIPNIDKAAEARRARERQLRQEGNALLARGNVQEAYKKFEELSKLAPNSPTVIDKMSKLSAIRRQEELGRQQLALAAQKRDEGVALFNQQKYTEAIGLLADSFSLNPSDHQTVTYLKAAQQEQEKLLADQAQKTRQDKSKTAVITPGGKTRPGGTAGDGGRTAASGPAQLTTLFNSPFSEGTILVKLGSETVAYENLFEERGRIIRRKYPRAVAVTKQLTPKNADLEIWVNVPSLKITEHHVIRANFLPGSNRRLVVNYNPLSKSFDYQLN